MNHCHTYSTDRCSKAARSAYPVAGSGHREAGSGKAGSASRQAGSASRQAETIARKAEKPTRYLETPSVMVDAAALKKVRLAVQAQTMPPLAELTTAEAVPPFRPKVSPAPWAEQYAVEAEHIKTSKS